MFTVEMDTDLGEGITIVTLDDKGGCDDVEVILYSEDVFIRQVDDDEGIQIICMTYQQLKDIIYAINLPEGAYYQNTSLIK